MKQNMQDLTEGPLGKKILIFSVPLMLSNLLQVLFNMADIAVIGQFAGSLSLGAVGSTATLVTMFTGFLIGLSGGINVLTALYYGAKDRESLSKTIHSAALVCLGCRIFRILPPRYHYPADSDPHHLCCTGTRSSPAGSLRCCFCCRRDRSCINPYTLEPAGSSHHSKMAPLSYDRRAIFCL